MNDWCPKCGKRHAQTTAGCPRAEYINLRDLTPEKMEELFGPPGEFKPHWYYNKAGDQIEVIWKNVPARGEYINKDVYLIRAIDTDEIIGVTAPSVLLRLEKEGVAYSAKKLAAVRKKLAEIWRALVQQNAALLNDTDQFKRGQGFAMQEFMKNIYHLQKLLEEKP